MNRSGNVNQITEDKETVVGAEHVKNANNQTIFGNNVLTSQFLREYTGLPIFADVKPEDIEDVSERYHAFLGVDFEVDTVKRVRVKLEGEPEDVYVLPLLEHKSSVDYDVAMQLLRYMVVIWYDYAKERNELQKGISHQKGFRYPLIVPIVYYEGTENWTADMHLRSRIRHAEQMKEYVPDFTYKAVQIHKYTNEELQKRNDEMALVILLNKIQTPGDYSEVVRTSKEFVDLVYRNAPEDIRKVIKDILWSLFMKMRVPVDEAQKMVEILEDGSMGYLFENMEEMDIQAERQNTKRAKEEAEAAKKEAEAAKKEAEAAKEEVEAAKKEAKAEKEKVKTASEKIVLRSRERGFTKEETLAELQYILGLDEMQAQEKIEVYWK